MQKQLMERWRHNVNKFQPDDVVVLFKCSVSTLASAVCRASTLLTISDGICKDDSRSVVFCKAVIISCLKKILTESVECLTISGNVRDGGANLRWRNSIWPTQLNWATISYRRNGPYNRSDPISSRILKHHRWPNWILTSPALCRCSSCAGPLSGSLWCRPRRQWRPTSGSECHRRSSNNSEPGCSNKSGLCSVLWLISSIPIWCHHRMMWELIVNWIFVSSFSSNCQMKSILTFS